MLGKGEMSEGKTPSRVEPGIRVTEMSGSACPLTDRKSTRLNSSHLVISYAVFCLKKKKTFLHLYHCWYLVGLSLRINFFHIFFLYLPLLFDPPLIPTIPFITLTSLNILLNLRLPS